MRIPFLLLSLTMVAACADDEDDGPSGTDTQVETDTGETGETGETGAPTGEGLVELVEPSQVPAPCDDGTLQGLLGNADSWTVGSSCSFISSAVANQAQSAALVMHMSIPDDGSLQAGDTFQSTWDPTAGVAENEVAGSARINQGEYLLEAHCNDAIINDPVVQATWAPIDGFMTLEVVTAEASDGTEAPFTGTLRLRGVVLQKDGAEDTCTVPDMDIPDQSWGWLPG